MTSAFPRSVAVGLTAFLLPLSAQVTFTEVPAAASGLRWTHDNGASAKKHLPETVGAGVAVLDFDGDGLMDLYFVNSSATEFFLPTSPLSNALYRNRGDGTFEDVTGSAGVEKGPYGMGAFAADYDGDGWTDLLITGFGGMTLYRNNGSGRFEDVTRKAGLDTKGWFTHAVFFDYNKDGILDLFVSNFVVYTPEMNRVCGDAEGKRVHYCIPRVFLPSKSKLYKGSRSGRFEDVSELSGIASVDGKSFAAVATDINNDGLPDLFVANDTLPNSLFLNLGDGRFDEVGLMAGVAFSETGEARSGMGVDAADIDSDGWEDLLVSNIDQEMFSYYRNVNGVDFVDDSPEVRKATRLLSGWGLRFLDYDNDGDPDLFLVNGHPDDMVETVKPLVTFAEPLLLFRNDEGKFTNVSDSAGAVFRKRFPGRGMATLDYDNDGDLDVVFTNNGDAPVLLRNDGGNRGNWVGLILEPTASNRASAGAIVHWKAGTRAFRRQRNAGGSYLSSHDPREILGLGQQSSAKSVEIHWPSGQIDRIDTLEAGRYFTVREGAGVRDR